MVEKSDLKETPILQQCRLAAHKYGLQLFRNNTGKLKDVTGRWVTFGLAIGSGDLLGWRTVVVTPEMVGKKLAIFTSVEVKGPGKKLTPAQENWMREVRRAGGIADVVYSPDDLIKLDTGT